MSFRLDKSLDCSSDVIIGHSTEAFQGTSITGKADNLIEICGDSGKWGVVLDCALKEGASIA